MEALLAEAGKLLEVSTNLFKIGVIEGKKIIASFFAAFDQFTFGEQFDVVRTGGLRQTSKPNHIAATNGSPL